MDARGCHPHFRPPLLLLCMKSGGLHADGYPGQTFVARLRVERSSFGLQWMEPA